MCSRNRINNAHVSPSITACKPIRKPKQGGYTMREILATVPANRKHEFKEFKKKGLKHLNDCEQNILMMYVWYAEPPNYDITKFIIDELQISPSHLDKTGWSALHYAASNPFVSEDILEMLTVTAG